MTGKLSGKYSEDFEQLLRDDYYDISEEDVSYNALYFNCASVSFIPSNKLKHLRYTVYSFVTAKDSPEIPSSGA